MNRAITRLPLTTFSGLAVATTLFVSGCGDELSLYEITEEVERNEGGETVLDLSGLNMDCTDEDADDGVTYVHRLEDGINYCTINIRWESLLISMADVKEGIDDGLDDEGAPDQVNSDTVEVNFNEVEVNEVAIDMIKEDEEGETVTVAFELLVAYMATLEITEVGGIVEAEWPNPADPSAPSSEPAINGLDEDDAQSQEVVDFLNEAYENEKDVDASGVAALELAYDDPEDLAEVIGSQVRVSFDVTIRGEGTYDVGHVFANE